MQKNIFTIVKKCALLFFMLLSLFITVHAQNADTINLALHKTTTASTTESDSYPASNATDGNDSTKWSSSNNNYKQWLTVDLGKDYNITTVIIKWSDTYFSTSYDIQVSEDNVNWSTLRSAGSATERTVDSATGLTGKGRYVKFNGRGRGGGNQGSRYRIGEFEVYGHEPDTTTPEQKVQVDTIEARLVRQYIPGKVDGSGISDLLNTQQANGSWNDIDYDTVALDLPAGLHLSRLQQMAVAFRTPGNAYYGSALLLQKILLGLGFYMNKNPQSTNWWYNDIGGPQGYMVPLILIKDSIPIDTVLKYSVYLRDQVPRFNGDAKNLSWIANISMYKGCIENNYAMVDKAFKAIYSTLQIVSGQDDEGIKIDYSYHQHHAQLYSGGYGLSLLSDLANTIQLSDGTDFIHSISDTDRQLLSDFVLKGTQLFGYRNMIDFGTIGRGISRQVTSNYNNIPMSFLKQMMYLDTTNEQAYTNLSEHLNGGIFPVAYQGNKYFWKSDIMTQHGANYYLSAKVISTRTYGTESLNGENVKGYNLPLGATNIVTDGSEYNLIYPVWDWTRIPGTTAVHNQDSTALDGYQIGTNNFAGGASNGQNGVIAFDGTYRQVRARKAYFFINNAMVCLGAGISANLTNPVYTSVNQAFLSGDINYDNGTGSQLFTDSVQTFSDLKWVHHRNVGYIFPEHGTVTLQKGLQKGTWGSIDIDGTNDTVAKNVFSLWIDHGNAPQDATYQYIVVPDKSLSEFQSYDQNNHFVIVQNDTTIQAVRNDSTHQYGIVFYHPGSVNLGDSLLIASNKSAIVFINKNGETYQVSVGDPLYTESSIQITINKKLSGTGASVAGDSTIILFTLPAGDSTGSTVTHDYTEAGTLPITLTGFNLSKAGKNVQVKWTTAWEQNTKAYEILRSSDRVVFKRIGMITSSDDPAMPHHYSFTDTSPFAGINYYKLQSIALNGDTTNEGVRSIILNQNNAQRFLVYPNPVHSKLTVQFSDNSYSDMTIYSIAGKVVLKKETDHSAKQNTLDVSSLSPGAYIISLSGPAGSVSVKFIKQ